MATTVSERRVFSPRFIFREKNLDPDEMEALKMLRLPQLSHFMLLVFFCTRGFLF